MIELLTQLFLYNKDANKRYIEVLENSNSIQDRAIELMSHILNAHEIWLNRIQPNSDNKPITPWDKREISSWDELNSKLYDKTEILLKNKFSEISSGKKIPYQTMKGDKFESKIIDILYHIINHASYHRGQISIFLREKELIPPNSDYIFYVRDL